MGSLSSEIEASGVKPVQESIGPNPYVIEIKHLKKSFAASDVLKDISLDVAKGESLAVLGKSGAGKSVLIKCIVGLLEPDEGTIILFGKDISTIGKKELAELRKKNRFSLSECSVVRFDERAGES